MGEKIVIAEYVGFAVTPSGDSEQNQDSFPMIPVGNLTTDTLPNQVIALDVQPFEAFTPEALQNLHSITNDHFSYDIENTSDNQNETIIQQNRRTTISIFLIMFFVFALVFFLVFGIYARYL